MKKSMQNLNENIVPGFTVWIFEGEDLPQRSACHPSAVFSSLKKASEWIGDHRLSGLLTGYVIDEPAFERSLRLGTVPKHQQSGALRQVWAGGEQHYHVKDGEIVGAKFV